MQGRSPRAVFLVGFMGAGKTSVGRTLAQLLGWSFLDLDERIEARQGLRITAIFEQRGEDFFRQTESAALRELLAGLGERAIVALGGGAFAQPQNVALLRAAAAPIVFLDAPVEELRQRCQAEGDQRPLARDQNQFRQLYEVRRGSYMGADLCVDTHAKSVLTVAREVASKLGLEPA